ncbi:hypothetical protein BDV32DRAFT_143356 [Aspergillus pseudonomiae]|uniref:Uncharacterized protein n=1 Tax=Aspergillus pseudonomiae TaxID=1506151 RepID=A0A5N7CXK1_9EURO|nr:uncharacterized protein BDV37DRAFT_275899 [Aspergillus pseudonomiae]KAB8253893.1 hypothetical protein BDV32DRAFT_143356 [Aspergillus pseudonomiae]KAE8398669.1 hypothetical protein BDV37DRAFT_275899 [Aspergillus pseudonomiae]
MSKSPIESHMPKPKKDIQRPSGSESPEVQHVEMASGPGASSHSNPIDLSDECQLYSRTPLPSRTLANARAALQQLVLRSRYGSSYIFEGCGSHDSINLPQPPPARVVGQSGVSSPRRSSSHSAGFDVRCAQEHALPEISFGANAPMPRWRIEHIHPLLARGSPTLRWVFDSGTDFAQFGWSEDMIYEYAYRWLEEALNDPSFGLYTRSNILDGHGEDPLPTLPPAPSTCYFQRWSQSSRTSDNCKDKADASEAPKQPSRTEQPFSGYHGIHNNYMFDFESSEGCNETDLELGRHKSTQMSGEATMDENQSMQFNGYRWVWFSIAFLVLSMFLCLFLYAFRIIK